MRIINYRTDPFLRIINYRTDPFLDDLKVNGLKDDIDAFIKRESDRYAASRLRQLAIEKYGYADLDGGRGTFDPQKHKYYTSFGSEMTLSHAEIEAILSQFENTCLNKAR
jgi:hypothetical protein